MAVLHQADLTPTKLELLAAWLPGRAWFAGAATDLARVASFRLDDPGGEVGLETMLVRAGEDGPVFQVPLTYRGAPLDDDTSLIGTTMHSVLGKRWVYDACGDPVYLAVLTAAMLGHVAQAQEFYDGQTEARAPSMTVTATGDITAAAPPIGAVHRITDADPTVIVTDSVELAIVRNLDTTPTLAGIARLTATWPGNPSPTPLAALTIR